MTREGFVASAQKCNGVCLLMSFDIVYTFLFGRSFLRVSMQLTSLREFKKMHFLINVPLYDIGLMTNNFYPNLTSLSCSLLYMH